MSNSQPVPDVDISSSPQRDAILRAAARLFRKRGYERTSVRQLAEAVGLQSGSLFHHFKTKDEILVSVMERGVELASAYVISALEEAKTPREKVEMLFQSYLTALLSDEYRDYMTVLLYDFRSLSPAMAQRVQKFRSQVEQRWQVILDEAVPLNGSSTDPRLKTQFILGAMNWTLQWYNPKGRVNLEEMAREFAQLGLVTCGLGTMGGSAKPASRKAAARAHLVES
jgi:TetR/AcrR family transcriptional regulator, cholesterol catabolism regulator